MSNKGIKDNTVLIIDDNIESDDETDVSVKIENTSDVLETNDDEPNVYKENFWPAKPEEPKGFTYKGKSKMMTYAVGKIKISLKKCIEKEKNGIKFRVLDSKKIGGATQVTIEISDKEGRGNAIADFWGPNKKKECTILLKKSKEHEERFVKLAAKEIIQPLLDCYISGRENTHIKNSHCHQKQV